MDDLQDIENPHVPVTRPPLSEKERRQNVQRRIDELRRRKRRERRRSVHPLVRVLPPVLLIGFFLLCLVSSLLAITGRSGSSNYLSATLPPSNGAELETVAKNAGTISKPSIPALAAYLMDPETGDVLYSKNADHEYAMASTTKIMTAILTIENAALQDPVVISEHASTVGESSAWLSKGETLTTEQLLYALLLQSANDAAVALAESAGGSEEQFVTMMNEKAAELGLDHTHFSNPHGLDQQGHYTSAHDLAQIAAYAMKNPLFRQIVSTKTYEIPWPGHPYPRVLENHNKLLKTYPYAIGIKTGYTVDAGKCLVAAAEQNGRQLISVVLNGGDSYWDQSVQLMEYGFNAFIRVEFAYSGEALGKISVGNWPSREVNVVSGYDLVFTVREDYLPDFEEASIYYHEHLPYPVQQGQEVGYMVVGEGTPAEKQVPLTSDSRQNAPNIFIRFFAFTGSVVASWWKGLKWIIPGI
jgi:serine-type D-Ala-D-Ala carboxypeptidase (penicillin-binding protein 5/6)